MAKVSNSFASYSATTNREDLADVIYNISPTETPIMNAIGRSKAANRTFEWSAEALGAVDLNNAQEEGFVAVNAAYTAPSRLSNSTQILSKNAVVTRSQETIKTAGMRSTMSHVVAMRSQELKRDIESIISQNQPLVVGNDSGTARKTRAFEHWIQTNVSSGTSYAYSNPTTAQTDGTARAYTETLLLDALQLAYTNGGEPNLLVMAPTQKRKFSAFTGRAATQVPVGEQKVVQTVDVYVSDFGTMKAVVSRFNRARTVLAIDPKMASLAYLDDFRIEDLAKTGDADVKLIVVELGLRVATETAHAKVADLT